MVSLDQFRQGVSALDGTELHTLKRARAFTVRIVTGGLLITPASSGTERLVSWPAIGLVLKRFNKQRSLSPSDYSDLSFHKSYILALLKASKLA